MEERGGSTERFQMVSMCSGAELGAELAQGGCGRTLMKKLPVVTEGRYREGCEREKVQGRAGES